MFDFYSTIYVLQKGRQENLTAYVLNFQDCYKLYKFKCKRKK